MGSATFSGPVRSENGFQHVAENSTTGRMDNYTTLSGRDIRRFYLEYYFENKLGINADLDQVYTVEIARSLTKLFSK